MREHEIPIPECTWHLKNNGLQDKNEKKGTLLAFQSKIDAQLIIWQMFDAYLICIIIRWTTKNNLIRYKQGRRINNNVVINNNMKCSHNQ